MPTVIPNFPLLSKIVVLQAPVGGFERSALNVYIDDREILEQEAYQRIDLNQDGIYSVQLSQSIVDITSSTTSSTESDQRFVYSNQDGDIILTSLTLDHSEGAKLLAPTSQIMIVRYQSRLISQ